MTEQIRYNVVYGNILEDLYEYSIENRFSAAKYRRYWQSGSPREKCVGAIRNMAVAKQLIFAGIRVGS
jgi:hypothetical protein